MRKYGAWAFVFMLAIICARISLAEVKAANVATVNKGEKKATINKGADDGLAPGMVFYLLDPENHKIGTATVIEAQPAGATVIYHMTAEGVEHPAEGMVLVYSDSEDAMKAVRNEVGLIIPQDTEIVLRVVDKLGSQINQTGDVFELKASHPVIINGYEVIKQDARAVGEVTYAKAAKGWGKSGALDLEVKYVEAADGSNIPLSFAVSEKKKNSYAKAALGGYATAFLGGGGVKGKKIWIDPGTELRVFVREDVRMAFVVSGAAGQGGAVAEIQQRESKPADETRVLFLGFQDSFNTDDESGNLVLASKLSAFAAYFLQWNTEYRFVKRHDVIGRTGHDIGGFFLKKGGNVPSAERYNTGAIGELGKEFDVDYVICGDILKYSLDMKKKRDWLKTIGAVTGGDVSNLDGQVKNVYEFDVEIEIMVYDVNRDMVAWSFPYKDFHQASMPLGPLNKLGMKPIPDHSVKAGGSTWNVYHVEGYELNRSDDPISFSATDEGFAVMRALTPLIEEMKKIL